MTEPKPPRTRLTRLPQRQVEDASALCAVLDAGTVAHLALSRDDGPVVLPVLYARDRDRLLLHGSTGSDIFRLAAGGAPVSVCVTLLDGLVFAASLFDSSANYRSAVVFGRCSVLAGAEKIHGLRVLSEHLMPGRWAEVGEPTAKDLAATCVLALPLDVFSVKVRSGPPLDAPQDGIWRGVLPIRAATDEPVADGAGGQPVPASLRAAAARLASP